MTLLIVDSPSFLPLANEANVGDKVFVRSDQTVRTFLDVSTATSFSYSLNNGGIEVDQSITDFFDSTKRFGFQMQVFAGTQTGAPLVSNVLNNVSGTVVATPASGDSNPISVGISGASTVVPFNPYDTITGTDSLYTQERKAGSFFLSGSSFVEIDSAGRQFNQTITDSDVDSNMTSKSFTLSTFAYDISSQSNQPILSTSKNSIIVKQNEIIDHGIRHLLKEYDSDLANSEANVDSHNGIMPPSALQYNQAQLSTIKDQQKWKHYAITNDGYQTDVFSNGRRFYTIPNPNSMFDAGTLSYKNFVRDKDAAFATKVLFPSNPSANATLFSMGVGTGNITSIFYNNSTGNLEIKCRQISANIPATSLFDGNIKVVRWDIQINPGRIRVWVNDSCICVLQDGTNPLTNYKWAEGTSAGRLAVLNPSGVTYQEKHTASTHNVLDTSAATISDGNVFWNSTLNDVGTYFLVDNEIGASQEAIYFEMKWIGPSYSSRTQRGYGRFAPWLVNGGWTGIQNYPPELVNSINSNIYQTNNPMFFETYAVAMPYNNLDAVRSHGYGFPDTPPGGDIDSKARYFQRAPTTNYVNWYQGASSTFSVFIDFATGIWWCLKNGHYGDTGGSNAGWGIFPGTVQFMLGANRTRYFQNNGQSFLADYRFKENTNAPVAANTYKLAFASVGGGDHYAPSHWQGKNPADTSRWLRKGNPDIQISFNPESWEYDPVDLLVNVVKPKVDNQFYMGGSGNVYSTTNLPVNGFYAQGDNIDNWFTNTPGVYNQLKHFSETTFKSYSEQTMSIGSAKLNINPNKISGSSFAADYAAKNGSSTVSLSGGGDITSNIQGASDNTVILLGPGTYTINATAAGYFTDHTNAPVHSDQYRVSSIFLGKKLLICGNTTNPSDVIINYIPYYADGYYGIFSIWNQSCDERCGLAFCKVNRDLSLFTHNRDTFLQQILHYYSGGGSADHVIFDFSNTAGNRSITENMKGFIYSYDRRDYDRANVVKKNRSFSNAFFKGYTRDDFPDYYASSYGKVNRLRFHNIAYVGPVPSDYEDDHTGYVVSQNSTVTFSDSDASSSMFNGYINGFELRKGIAFDSNDFSTHPSQREASALSDNAIKLLVNSDRDSTSATANRSFRFTTNVEPKELIKVEDNGKVLVARNGILTEVANFSIPQDTWTHIALTIDSNKTATLRKNGSTVTTINNFLDSHNINATKLLLGSTENFTDANRFDKSYANDVNIKDFELTDSDISNDPAPTGDFQPTPKSRLLVGNNNANELPNATFISGNDGQGVKSVTGTLFSPYLESDRKFFSNTVSLPGFTGVTVGHPFGSLNNNLDPGAQDFLLEYPADIIMGVKDSPDLPVLITLANKDADNDTITWSYEEKNDPRRAIIGHDSAGYKFLIKKFIYSGDSPSLQPGFHSLAEFSFTGTKSNGQPARTLYLPNVNSIESGGDDVRKTLDTIKVFYDRFGVEILEDNNFTNSFITLELFDSDANQLLSNKINFIFDSYPHTGLADSDFGTIPGTSTKISSITGPVFRLDSLGVLP